MKFKKIYTFLIKFLVIKKYIMAFEKLHEYNKDDIFE